MHHRPWGARVGRFDSSLKKLWPVALSIRSAVKGLMNCSGTTISNHGGKKMWCVPELNEAYVRHMEDVLEVYERPYNRREPVVCFDERPVPLRDSARHGQDARPGRIAREDSEYVRLGTANVFCAVEPLAGRHFTKATPNRGGMECARMLQRIAQRYRGVDTIHLVMDQLNTHTKRTLVKNLGPKRGAQLWGRFTVHHTPKHGSWLNMAETEISILSRQCLHDRRIPSLTQLTKETDAWNDGVNCRRVKILWKFTRRKARRKFGYRKPRSSRTED